MLELPASAPLHSSLAGCPYCENFCYDHYLEWRWRRASVVCPAVPRARANFSGGLALARSRIRSRSRSPNLNRNPNPSTNPKPSPNPSPSPSPTLRRDDRGRRPRHPISP